MKYLTLLLLLLPFRCTAQQPSYRLTDTIALSGADVLGQSRQLAFRRDSLRLLDELRAMSESDQRYRKSGSYYKEHVAEQNAIDSVNTLRLLELTEQYGFPSARRFRLKKAGIFPHIIWVHAPQRFWEKLKPVVAAEYANRNMGQSEYAHIMWHLNGREGIPLIEGAKVKRKKNGRVVQHFKSW